MIKEYLEKRKDILSETISLNKEKYEHNQIEIFEFERDIEDIENNEDVATKLFSIKSRENETQKSKEIQEIENKIDIVASKNSEIKTIIEDAEKELNIVKQCLENVSRETFSEKKPTNMNEDVSRETSNENEEMFTTQNEHEEIQRNKINSEFDIVEKLEFCKRLTRIDANRVYIELDNLIKKLR